MTLWAQQREKRLNDHLKSLRELATLLDELMDYLNRAERTLVRLEEEPLPESIVAIEQLIKDHQDFTDDLSSKQKDVEKVTKGRRLPTDQEKTSKGKTSKDLPKDGKLPKGFGGEKVTIGKVPRTSTPTLVFDCF